MANVNGVSSDDPSTSEGKGKGEGESMMQKILSMKTNMYGFPEDDKGNVYIFSTKQRMKTLDSEYLHCINLHHIKLTLTSRMENHFISYDGQSDFFFVSIPMYVTGYTSTFGPAILLKYKGTDDDVERNRLVHYGVFNEANKTTFLEAYKHCSTRSNNPVNYVKYVGETVPSSNCMGKLIWMDDDQTISGVVFTKLEFSILQTMYLGKNIIMAMDKPENIPVFIMGKPKEKPKKEKITDPTKKKERKKEKKELRKEQLKAYHNTIETCIDDSEDSNSDDDDDDNENNDDDKDQEKVEGKQAAKSDNSNNDVPFFPSSLHPNGVCSEKVGSLPFVDYLKRRMDNKELPPYLCKLTLTVKIMNHQVMKKKLEQSTTIGGVAGKMGLESDIEVAAASSSSPPSLSTTATLPPPQEFQLTIGTKCNGILILREAKTNEVESSDNQKISELMVTGLQNMINETDVKDLERPCRNNKRKRIE